MGASVEIDPGSVGVLRELIQTLVRAGASYGSAYVILAGTACALILLWRWPQIIRARAFRKEVENRHVREMLRIRKDVDARTARSKQGGGS